MKINKIYQLAIYTESNDITEWLCCTLRLTLIGVEEVHKLNKVIDLSSTKASLIIVSEEKFKAVFNYLNKAGKVLPILVITKDFNSFRIPITSKLTIDTLPLSAVTVSLFEHSIKAVMQDFKLNQKLITLAHYDPLTGAANRLLFQDRISQIYKIAKRSKKTISLLYFDLDDFKPINDNYGHDIGDELLKTFVKLISSLSRETDTLARLGGDEFVLLLPDTSELELENICKKIVDCLSVKQNIKEHLIEIKCSIGAASQSSVCTQVSPEELLKKADQGVYQAKKKEGTTYVIT